MHKTEQRVAVGNLQHVIPVTQIRILRNKTISSGDTFPIFPIGFSIMERVSLFEEITCCCKPIPVNDGVVRSNTMRSTRRPSCH